MKVLALVGIGLLLLCVESVAVKSLGFSVTRVDVTLLLVVFLSLSAGLVEGAFAAFALGYLLDVFTGRPTGLFPFLAVLTYLVVRLGSVVVDARGRGLFALVTGAAVVAHGLFATFFTWLTSRAAQSPVASVSGLPLQAVLTMAAALALWPLLQRLDPGKERPEPGALR
ncbi:MAG: hypothetical protein K1X89_09100 [Myxococcaceae bacterium]|nr:hypothetical protein [Myxococcaceae bacterium]